MTFASLLGITRELWRFDRLVSPDVFFALTKGVLQQVVMSVEDT